MKEEDNNQENGNELKNYTSLFTKEEIESGRTMSIISYISVLVLIPYFNKGKNKYVDWHAKQGMNIFIYEALLFCFDKIISPFLPGIGFLGYIGIVFLTILSLISIIYVISGEARELPIIDKIKIIR